MKKDIYLDYAAATPVAPGVFAAMQPYFATVYANPSALYGPAVRARNAIEDARKTVAGFLHAQPDTVVFASGGTPSNNLGILGICAGRQSGHIITTQVEHSSVLEPIKKLEEQGFDVTYLPVDTHGSVSVHDMKKALRKDTVLVSVMYVNNEVGSIQPVQEIGREILKFRKKNETALPYFHVDACQAANYLDMSVERIHCDLLSFNGSKIYGPKGSGVLYVRRGVELEPIIYGGGQERGLRSGTEDVPNIVGLGKAVELIGAQDHKSVEVLRDYFWKEIESSVDRTRLNGPELGEGRLSNNLNVCFEGIESEALVLYLDAKGIYCSAGSACNIGNEEGSHVLEALGCSSENIRGSVRFTLGRSTTKEDVDYVMSVLPDIVQELRDMKKVSDV